MFNFFFSLIYHPFYSFISTILSLLYLRLIKFFDLVLQAKDMMSYAQAQGDLLKHALMTGTMPPHVKTSGLFQKSAQKVRFI